MAPILTAEDAVRRIAAECAYVDERGGVGIRLEPAAAIVHAVWRAISQRDPPRSTGNPSAESRAVAVSLRDGNLLPELHRRPEQRILLEVESVRGITQCHPSPRKTNGCVG
jgi:hypothetical protein